MKIEVKGVTNGPINWPKHTQKLYDADGEVKVGDIVRYNGKPCFVEKIQDLVTIVTMDERKITIRVRPDQIGCVFGRDE